MRENYEQLYANKLDNLEDTGKLLETYIQPTKTDSKRNNLKRPITR